MLDALERHLARGQWLQAKEAAWALIHLTPGMLTTKQLGRAYCGFGRACARLQEPLAATTLFEKAIENAFQARDWDTLGFSRAQLGSVLLVNGEPAAANEMFAAYYLDLPRYKEAKACEALVRFNNALALRRQHRHGESVVAYHMALDLCVQRGHTTDAAQCQQNLAWLYLLENKAAEALPHLECAQSYAEALDGEYRAEMLVCWGFYHYVRRELGTAMEYLAEVLGRPAQRAAQSGITAHHVSEAAWLAGEIALLLGRAGQAKRLGEAARSAAIKAVESEQMNRATDLLARARSMLNENSSEAAE